MATSIPPRNRAKGAIEAPHLSDGYSDEIGSSRNIALHQVTSEFRSRTQLIRQYDIMARTDVTCGVSLRVSKAPVVGATFYFEPPDIDNEELALDMTQFAEDNIMKLTATPWLPTLGKICRMYQYGVSVLEDCWKLDEWSPKRKGANTKTYTMLRKLAHRPIQTIDHIELDDNGGPKIIWQNAIDASGKVTRVPIPIEKAAIFNLGDSDDYWGESVLRAAIEHWEYKKYLYKIDAIQKERHSLGVPYGVLPPGANANDRKILRKLLANIRANEESFFIVPPGYEIGFAKVEGQLVNALESASAHDTMILLNVMAQFMILGLESAGSGGGRSTAAASLDLFYKSLWYIANLIADVINTYIVPKLIQYNFDTDRFPLMKVRNIGQSKDLQQIAAAMSNLFDKQVITPDLPTENWTRDLLDMPRKTGDKQTPVKVATPAGPANQNGTGNKDNVSPTGVRGGGNSGASPTSA